MAAKKKILVIDDNIDFLDVIKVSLEVNNFTVAVSSTSKNALEKIRSEKPDAVLLDIMMPETDGIEILKKIRKENANLPVFIISAFSNEERFKLAGGLNATGFILKTGNMQDEIANIASILGVSK